MRTFATSKTSLEGNKNTDAYNGYRGSSVDFTQRIFSLTADGWLR